MANTLKLGAGKWATGTDTVLAFNDLNNNFKPLAFSFSRASSATVVNQSGLIETVGSGTPRIDFEGNTEGALLLEPTRTNSITYSKDFTSWTQADTSTISIADSFDGSNNAYKVSIASAGGFQTIRNTGLSVSGVQTFTIYAKKDTLNFIRVLFGGHGNFWVDLVNGTQGTTTGAFSSINITSAGNGFFKIVAIFTPTSAVTQVFLYPSIGNGNVSQTSGSVIFQYAQLEAGSYATSYIPTSGSAVTRVAETSSQTTPDGVIGQTEGVLYCDVSGESPQENSRYMSISNFNDGNKRLTIYQSGGNLNVYCSAGATFNLIYALPQGRLKIAVGYKSGDYVLYVNGTLAAVSTESAVVACSDVGIGVNEYLGTSNPPSVGYNDLKLYNTRLSNAELASLTTI